MVFNKEEKKPKEEGFEKRGKKSVCWVINKSKRKSSLLFPFIFQ